jgi:hypothetical protein
VTVKREPLKEALTELQRQFPNALLTEVRLDFRAGERHDGRPSETWTHLTWTVQVENEHGHGGSFDEAVAKLRVDIEGKARVPQLAERIADILGEVSGEQEFFLRHDVLRAVQELLDQRRSR